MNPSGEEEKHDEGWASMLNQTLNTERLMTSGDSMDSLGVEGMDRLYHDDFELKRPKKAKIARNWRAPSSVLLQSFENFWSLELQDQKFEPGWGSRSHSEDTARNNVYSNLDHLFLEKQVSALISIPHPMKNKTQGWEFEQETITFDIKSCRDITFPLMV